MMVLQRLLAGSGVVQIKLALFYAALYAGIVAAVYVATRYGRCRSHVAGLLLAIVVTLAALVAAHATPWVREPGGRAARTSLIAWTAQRASNGLEVKVSRTTSFRVNGWEAWGLWGTEAAGILFLAAGAAVYAVQAPFCEACTRYANGSRRSFRVKDPHEEYISAIKHATSVEPMLLAKERQDAKVDRDLEFHRSSCGCGELQLLKVELIKYKKGKGRTEVDERSDIRERLILEPEEADAIDGLGDEVGWEVR